MQQSAAKKSAPTMPLPGEQMGEAFSLKTHYFDARGRKLGQQPYRLWMNADGDNFERPVNSGNLFLANGQPNGRYIFTFKEDGSIKTKKYDPNAKHIAFVTPLTGSAKIEQELHAEKQKTAALLAELEAIKAEQKTKTKDVPPAKQAASGAQTGAPPTLDPVAAPKAGS